MISLIQEEIEKELSDYKIHCFNGVAKVILVCQDRFSSTGLTEDFFDTDWHHLEVYRKRHGNSKNSIPTPAELKQMLILAEKLSKDIPFVRVDCYVINSQIYFGELTFFPASGFERFCPDQFDEQLGGWIHQ